MECNNIELCEKYQLQLQMLTSWLNKREDVIDFEIIGAAYRNGINLDNLYCILPHKSV